MKKRIIALFLSLCLLFTACSGSSEMVLRADELLAVGDIVCTWPQAQIFILSQYSKYTSVYGKGIWQVEMAEGNFESYIKEGLLDYLKLLYLADYGARKEKLELSQAEQSAVSRAAEAYMQALGEEGRQKTGISREAAEAAYASYARAQIFYRQAMINGQVEISDEEARVISIQLIEVEQQVGYVQTREMLKDLEAGKSLSEVLRGQDGVSSRREQVVRGQYPQDLETIAFSLKEGQWSPIITQDASYYLLHSLSAFEREATAQHKAEMEKQARDENLNRMLKQLADTVQLIYNPKRWEAWTMQQYEECPAVNFYDYVSELIK